MATVPPGEDARVYRTAVPEDYRAVHLAQVELEKRVSRWKREGGRGLCPVPNEPLPPIGTLGFRVQRYGMTAWGDLFSTRQALAVGTLCRLIHDCAPEGIRPLVTLLISKVIDLNNALTVWHNVGERPAHMLSRWAIPMKWDYVEPLPLSEYSGSLDTALARTMHLLREFAVRRPAHLVSQADACEQLLPDDSVAVWFTDPPYYDAIPYSDLSDFFFVWLRRALPESPLLRNKYDASNPLTPKTAEAVQDEQRQDGTGKTKDKAYFETKIGAAFAVGRRVLREDGIGTVVFAHKTTEGWEALLSGMINGGWTITGSWPLATEMSSRLRARDSAALDTSIHLVCRPRSDEATVGDWAEVLRELPPRVGQWIERLQGEGIRGADLVFGCIGPALEIFSRYSRVETADGREVKLAEYLPKVWEVVGRTALEQVLGTAEAKARNGAAGALEEDARLTALFLWTLQSTEAAKENGKTADDEEAEGEDDEDGATNGKKDGFTLIFDVVRRFAQPLGIQLPRWEDRIIETDKGIVRLLPIAERAKQLFGESSVHKVAAWLEEDPAKNIQPLLFQEMQNAQPVKAKPRGRGKKPIMEASDLDMQTQKQATTLDRVHAAMLLQAGGQSNALRSLIQGEQQRGPDFLRLANALSALYPRDSEEKRLLDAMLLAVPR